METVLDDNRINLELSSLSKMDKTLSKIPSLLVPEKEPVVEKINQKITTYEIAELLKKYLKEDNIEGIKEILDRAYLLLGHDHELVKNALEVLAEKRYTFEEIQELLQKSRKCTVRDTLRENLYLFLKNF